MVNSNISPESTCRILILNDLLNESDINKLLSEKDSKSTKKNLKIAKNLFLDFVNTNFPKLSDCLSDRTGNDSAQTPDKTKLDKTV